MSPSDDARNHTPKSVYVGKTLREPSPQAKEIAAFQHIII